MRIKSYFAPSVQAAIALARKEFGDNVTLVTSHVASLDNRHLGEYEVVFAIEEAMPEVAETPAPEPVAETPAPVFTQLFQQAVEAPSPIHQNVDEKLENMHSTLVSLGLEAAVVRSFMTMLKAVLPTAPAAITLTPIATIPPPTPAPILTAPTPIASAPTPDWSAPEPKPTPKPKITVIKPEPQPFKPEPPKPEPTPVPAPAPATANTRPFLSLFEAARPEPRFSAAELAFMSSVSSNDQEQKA